MSNFIFNDHGVCINPIRVVIIDTDKVNLVVKICKINGGWVSGYNYSVRGGQEGGASPASIPCAEHHVVYSTEDDAIRSQLKYFEARFSDFFSPAIKAYLSPKTLQLF